MRLGFYLKKIFASILLIAIVNIQCVFADGIKGYVNKDDTKQETERKIFTGETERLDKKDTINMTVSQILSSGYSVEGDEFFAEVSNDVEGDKGVIIPVGTVAHGKIITVQGPKNNGRDGWVDIDFDYLVTPDGSQIPIHASFSTKNTPVKGAVKTVAHHTGYTLLGGAVGGFLALQYLGLGAAIASNGYTLAGGAAIGGAVGLTMAIIKKGKGFMIKPGDELKIKIEQEVDLPVYSPDAFRQEEVKLEGLNVRINSVSLEKDPFGVENTITLSLGIDNYTDYHFSTFDIALVSNTQESFFPSPFGDTSLWFKTIAPGDRVIGKLSFNVSDKKARHWLVFFDRKTKKPLARISVDNAKSDLKQLAKEKKAKKSRKS